MDNQLNLTPVREFVLAFKDIQDVQFAAVPYPLASHEGIAYLLLVASINQGTSAENVRDLMRALYDLLGDDLLKIQHVPQAQYLPVLKKWQVGWRIGEQIPRILASAGNFIEVSEKHGGLIERGKCQPDAVTAARKIVENIYFMGSGATSARKKVWMFMRWMVRPAPDIGIWNPPLKPADLRIPLDSNTGKAFQDLVRFSPFKEWMADQKKVFEWEAPGKMASTASNVEIVTELARMLFPDDPARVEYAFFCYGRRFGKGEAAHRCWSIVGCKGCPLKSFIGCAGI